MLRPRLLSGSGHSARRGNGGGATSHDAPDSITVKEIRRAHAKRAMAGGSVGRGGGVWETREALPLLYGSNPLRPF